MWKKSSILAGKYIKYIMRNMLLSFRNADENGQK